MFYASQRPGYFGSAASFSGPLSIQRPTYQEAFEAGTGQDREAIFGDPGEQEFYWAGHNPTELVANLRHDAALRRRRRRGRRPRPVPTSSATTSASSPRPSSASRRRSSQRAARGRGADVTYAPHQGIHDWPYWRADLANAIAWGFFARPSSAARRLDLSHGGVQGRDLGPALPLRAAAGGGRDLRPRGTRAERHRLGPGRDQDACRVPAGGPADAVPGRHAARPALQLARGVS